MGVFGIIPLWREGFIIEIFIECSKEGG